MSELAAPIEEQLPLVFYRPWADLTPAERNQFVWEASDGNAGIDPTQSTSTAEQT